jgi:hypothetical protein
MSVLCLVAFLGLPMVAQAETRPLSRLAALGAKTPLSGLLSSAWERLATPLASLWAADEAPVVELIPPVNVPPPDGDSRGGWDPEG